MKMSDIGKRLLMEWEGVRLEMYRDPVGLPTIGVGHLLTRDELHSGKIWIKGIPIDYNQGLSEENAMDLLSEDLERFEEAVNEEVTAPLSQSQFDALIGFSFNVGLGPFRRSTLLKLLNDGKYDEVPGELLRWTHGGGETIAGLINRREKEIGLWNA